MADAATPEYYHAAGLTAIPTRGPLAANTVAGTISGWDAAINESRRLGGRLPLSRLVEDAVWYAENGFAVTQSQAELTAAKLAELRDVPGFAATYLRDGHPPLAGEVMKLPALARTLRRIGEFGAADFYRGELAASIAADLARCGSPVSLADLAAHRSRIRVPLSVRVANAELCNFPPPNSGPVFSDDSGAV